LTGERFFQLDRPTSATDDEELKMKLRPRYNGHQNVILCHSACSPSGLFLQVNERDTYSYLRSKYPDVENILYLPPSFSTVVSYLKVDFSSGTFGRTFYHLLLNREITTYFSNLTATRFDRLGTDLFPTIASVEFFCFNIIVEDYIKATSGMFRGRTSRRNYLSKLNVAKENWILRREMRLNQEGYLGSNNFDAELKRSCSEYYCEARKALGCTPMRWYSIN